MDVVIYARYSCNHQNEQSIEAQLKECRQFAERNGYIVIGEYIDRAMSGTNDHRIEFQKMIEDSNKKQFQGILVYQLDRFARNRYDSALYKAILKKNGVRVYSARENISDDASGIILESVLEGMAEYFSVELSQKVKRNMNLNAESCFFNGGYVPLGYKTKKIEVIINGKKVKKSILEINEKTAPIVRQIFEMYANGKIMKEIVSFLNAKQYETSIGTEFKLNSLGSLLKNEKYIGIYKYGDIEIKDGVPRIIDDNTFFQVQEIMKKNKKSPARGRAKEEYLLTTKLFCGHCNSLMVGISGTSDIGKTYNYYSCNDSRKKLCHKKNIRKDYIENIAISECYKLLTDENINIIAKEVEKVCKEEANNTNLKWLNKQFRQAEEAIKNLIVALEQGQNIDIISERITQKRQEQENIKKEIAIEQMKHTILTAPQIRFFLTKLKNGDMNDINYRKLLISIFINAIYLYDNELTIVFNSGDKSVTINIELLKDIKKHDKDLCIYPNSVHQDNSNINIYFSVKFYLKLEK